MWSYAKFRNSFSCKKYVLWRPKNVGNFRKETLKKRSRALQQRKYRSWGKCVKILTLAWRHPGVVAKRFDLLVIWPEGKNRNWWMFFLLCSQTHCDILPSGLCHRRLLLKGLRASFQSMGTHGYQGLHKPFNNSNSSSFNPAATSETSQTDLEAQRKSNYRGTKSLSSRSFTKHAATQRYHGQGHGQSQVYGQGARGWKR